MISEKISEETKTILGQLLQIYQMLVNQPDPEEEEEAQKKLLLLLTDFPLDQPELWNKIQDLKKIVEEWDTLDQWYTEVDKLDTMFKKMLQPFFPDIFKEPTQQSKQSESKKDPEPPLNPMKNRIQSRLQAMEDKMFAFVKKEHPQKSPHPAPVHIPLPTPSPDPKSTIQPTPSLTSGLSQQQVRFTPTRSKLQAPKIIIPKMLPKKPQITPQSVPILPVTSDHANEKKPAPPIQEKPLSFSNIESHTINGMNTQPQKPFSLKITQVKSTSRILRPEEVPNLNPTPVAIPITQVAAQREESFPDPKSVPLNHQEDNEKDNAKVLAQSDVDQYEYQNLVQLEAKKIYYSQQIHTLQSDLEKGQISNGDFQHKLSEVNSLLLHCYTDIDSMRHKLKTQEEK